MSAKLKKWARALHVGLSIARELADDPELDSDDNAARTFAKRLKKLGENQARAAAGCTGVGCKCIVCEELGAP